LNKERLYRQYRAMLAEGIIPFWMNRGADYEYGGVLSVMQEDGTPISGDKYTWSQARFVWTLSALYNRFERRPEFLDLARKTIDFLLRHARDEEGRVVYRTTREGRLLDGAISIYADCFLVYGISEYCRACPDSALLATALEIFRRVRRRVEEPDFHEVAPYALPPGRRVHAVPMILTEVANELALTTGDAAIAAAADDSARQVMNHFVRPRRKLLLEFLSRDYAELPPNEGDTRHPGARHRIDVVHSALGAPARRPGDDPPGRGSAPVAPGGRVGRRARWDSAGHRCGRASTDAAECREESLVAAHGGPLWITPRARIDRRALVRGMVRSRTRMELRPFPDGGVRRMAAAAGPAGESDHGVNRAAGEGSLSPAAGGHSDPAVVGQVPGLTGDASFPVLTGGTSRGAG